MVPILKKISKFNFSKGNSPKYIIIHDTGNFKDTAAANANHFNGGNRDASAHYFVDEETIYQVVEEFNCAWHVGDGKGKYGIINSNSIGIEMCNSGGYIDIKTICNTVELVKTLQAKYNIPNDRVLRHYDASRKICPENMSKDNWKLWNEFKAKLEAPEYNGETIVLVDSPNSTDYLAAQYFNKYLGYGILTPELYRQRANPKDTLIGLGGAVCNRIKCTYPVIGKDGVDTCQKAMELIQSLR